MKKNLKLSRYISVVLGLVTVIMIVVYSLLVHYSLFSGMEDVVSYSFELRARDFAAEYAKDTRTQLPEFERLKSYLDKEDLPEWFEHYFQYEPIEHSKIEMDYIDGEIFDVEKPFFFIAFAYDLHDGKRLYQVETHTEEDEIKGSFQNSARTEKLVLIMGIIFIILAVLTLRYVFGRVSKPVENLLDWARNMNQDGFDKSHPDFRFKEINHLADLIEEALLDLHQALNREHQFLRSTSHELRTPIAIIKTNIDLLERIRSHPEKIEKKSHDRIRRAVDNMHSMTETLLWMSRKEESIPESESVDVEKLIDELIKENRYLLSGKKVELNLKSAPARIKMPRTALRIVLSNLIRNAFQYTNQGHVDIDITHNSVIITNINQGSDVSNKSGDEYGFGLGLMLVEQICEKIHLTYDNEPSPAGYKASLIF